MYTVKPMKSKVEPVPHPVRTDTIISAQVMKQQNNQIKRPLENKPYEAVGLRSIKTGGFKIKPYVVRTLRSTKRGKVGVKQYLKINKKLRQMDLSELLDVSEYIDKLIHREPPQLPDSAKAADFIKCLRFLKRQEDFVNVISMLNAQIILKNRNSVDHESAIKVYDNFINAE